MFSLFLVRDVEHLKELETLVLAHCASEGEHAGGKVRAVR